MTGFSETLRDALLMRDATASTEAVHNAVIHQLRELDSKVRIRATGYFNHSWLPDLQLAWSDAPPRNLFLRFDTDDPDFADEITYAAGEDDAVFLDIAQPDLGLINIESHASGPPAGQNESIPPRVMVTEHQALGQFAEGLVGDPTFQTATRQFVRGGRGLVDGDVAEQVVKYYREANLLLLETGEGYSSEVLRQALDRVEAQLSPQASTTFENELLARWVEAGRPPELFPSLEPWDLSSRTPEEIAALVAALIDGQEPVPADRWQTIAKAVSAEGLGVAFRGRKAVKGGRVNDLVRAAHGLWTARWAWTAQREEPSTELFDWELGATSLQVDLGTHRAIFCDNGSRLNTLPRPSDLPRLEPHLDVLANEAVTGITVVTLQEEVALNLRATATETLGQRLSRLMAEQAELRISGRIAQLNLVAPDNETRLTLSFETGRAYADPPLGLAEFAAILARFVAWLQPDEIGKMTAHLAKRDEPVDDGGE